MEKYKIRSSVKLEFKDNELIIVDMETGFVGKGNASAYDVLVVLNEERTKEELINKVAEKYPESQKYRIDKSVPKIIAWALERSLIEVAN